MIYTASNGIVIYTTLLLDAAFTLQCECLKIVALKYSIKLSKDKLFVVSKDSLMSP